MILIQARSTSERFPNKSMALLDGHPVIRHVYDHCGLAHKARWLVIPNGDPLRDYLRQEFIPFYEGSLTNVLERYYHCAKTLGLAWAVRVTGDCPLISPAQIAMVIQMGTQMKFDFVTNCRKECTDGQEVEFISFRLLEYTYQTCVDETDREHVTTWIKKSWDTLGNQGFKLCEYNDPMPMGPKMSIDTPEDLERVQAMLDRKKAK